VEAVATPLGSTASAKSSWRSRKIVVERPVQGLQADQKHVQVPPRRRINELQTNFYDQLEGRLNQLAPSSCSCSSSTSSSAITAAGDGDGDGDGDGGGDGGKQQTALEEEVKSLLDLV
jgi:hypothetical protein